MKLQFVLITLPLLTIAINLYVSSYAGLITTLALTSTNSGNYSLSKVGATDQCGPNPSWLTVDLPHGLLFCLNEGLATPNGSLSSFTISSNGSLSHVQNTTTISGPVNGVIFGPPTGPYGIALAHYTGSALSSFLLSSTDAGNFTAGQQFDFTLSSPGPNPSRQDASHAHEAILDPTGTYILVPDLGADLVRIFSWSSTSTNLTLTALEPFHVPSGSGPRHAAFYTPNGVNCVGCPTFMYLVSELSSTIATYAVTYLSSSNGTAGGLNFTQLQIQSTYGSTLQPPGNAPAEVAVSPDNRFVVVSNRNDSSFVLPDSLFSSSSSAAGSGTSNASIDYFPQFTYASTNSTLTPPDTEDSDSVSTFAIQADGTVEFVQLAPAGGSYPRTMAISPDGSLVAVGLQYSNRTVVYERDVVSGVLGALVAEVEMNGEGEGNVTCVQWGR